VGTTSTFDDLRARAGAIADRWRAQRPERQARDRLDRADFDELAEAGYLLTAVPRSQGGLWESVPSSARPVAEVLRTIARGDPSVALVSAMHPAVLSYWLASADPAQPAWEEQREAVFASAAAGRRWGTITSEPGSGGDIMKTRTRAVAAERDGESLPGATFRLTGDKHFGSGLGIVDYMLTTAVADGDDAPSAYFITTTGLPDDADARLRVIAPWDGAGMRATQSHAARLEGMPAVRLAWSRPIEEMTFAAGAPIGVWFVSVVLGVLDEAMATARAQLEPKRDALRAYEQVEWSRADTEHWLAVQAYEGALRAIETGDGFDALRSVLRAKVAIAELAERALSRVTKVLGGGTFSRRSPFAAWAEDVRALGFLRPPWGLAYDQLFATSG
jgi:alkylation response protein AidB-like acyl-CoA dehydrogenase